MEYKKIFSLEVINAVRLGNDLVKQKDMIITKNNQLLLQMTNQTNNELVSEEILDERKSI